MNQEDKVAWLLERGQNQLNRGEYEAALETYREAAARERETPQILYGLGMACFWLEQYRKSLDYLTEALQVEPFYILAFAWRGRIYRHLNEKEQAKIDCDRAISIEPQDDKDWLGRGDAFYLLRQYERALTSYDKAIELKPDSHLAWKNRGDVLFSLDRYERAISAAHTLRERFLRQSNRN